MVLNSLLPVFLLVLLGGLLKRFGLTHDDFLKTSDRLIYYIFFPAMLFWKIGGAPLNGNVPWRFCLAAICALLCIYGISFLCLKLFKVSDFQAGSYSQSCYRFNTYIGIAIVMNALGEPGIAYFGILIGFIIPLINVLAVSTLIWFSGTQYETAQRLSLIGKALVSNPLIVACLAGIAYAGTIQAFPVFIDNTFRLMSMVTLPLALLSIGGSLTFKTLRHHLKISLLAAVIKLLFFPLAGYYFLTALDVKGIAFQTGMIFFTLPTSTALYVLSSQLNSDTNLASASIVLSTLLSFLSLSVALILFF